MGIGSWLRQSRKTWGSPRGCPGAPVFEQLEPRLLLSGDPLDSFLSPPLDATNSGLKRRTGLRQLHVRSAPRLFHTIYLKVTGWNILQSSACARMQEIVYQRANMAVFFDSSFRFRVILDNNTYVEGSEAYLDPLRAAITTVLRLPVAAW